LWLKRGEHANPPIDEKTGERKGREVMVCYDARVRPPLPLGRNAALTACVRGGWQADTVHVTEREVPVIRMAYQCHEPKEWMLGNMVLLMKPNRNNPGEPDVKSMVFATVEDDPGGNAVGLQFEPDQLARFELWSQYYMLESPAYYAAYRPVLEWLESGDLNNVPIGMDILSGDPSDTHLTPIGHPSDTHRTPI